MPPSSGPLQAGCREKPPLPRGAGSRVGDQFIDADTGILCDVVWTGDRPLLPSGHYYRKNGTSLGNYSKERRAARETDGGSRGAVGRVDHRLSRGFGVRSLQ